MEIKTANECYITDTEGNVYIDTTMGSGAQIIGHNNFLIRQIGKQIKDGTIYTIPNHHTNRVDDYLKNYINPDFYERYIYCNSGTEANMRAIRLARAFTGKSLIGRFHGGWHGGLDGFLEEHPNNKGVPIEVNNLFKVLPYNDEECFQQITKDMEAVIIEPTQGSNPRTDVKDFLHKLRNRCSEVGALLIFDEVMTGFRLSANGGSGIFNVRPDIITYGKVLGGGFPIGAVGGRPDVMKTKNVFYGGTFSANPLSMNAASLILETIINKEYIQYDKLHETGKMFRDELNKFFTTENKKMRVIGCGPLSRIVFTDKFIRNRKDRDTFETENAQEIFSDKLKNLGVFVNGNGLYHFSMAHTPDVVEELIFLIKKGASSHDT